MKKPTVEQVAWVFKHLADGIKEPGTFRYLIYDRMGFGPEAYNPLYSAGGMLITNTIWEQQEKRESNAPRTRGGCVCDPASGVVCHQHAKGE